MLKSKEAVESWSISTRKLVIEFTTTSLLKLASGKLRSAYIAHVMEFYQSRFEEPSTDPDEILTDLDGICETVVQELVEGCEMLDQSSGIEILSKMISLSFAHLAILKSSTTGLFKIVKKQAQNAGELRQRITVCTSFRIIKIVVLSSRNLALMKK